MSETLDDNRHCPYWQELTYASMSAAPKGSFPDRVELQGGTCMRIGDIQVSKAGPGPLRHLHVSAGTAAPSSPLTHTQFDGWVLHMDRHIHIYMHIYIHIYINICMYRTHKCKHVLSDHSHDKRFRTLG